ncbi:MAG: hypothetical protein CME64_02255 [Halobacteriovoraceae bacterium]|nr:hypothetical protein [Halobacteriovoraceae bacterium]
MSLQGRILEILNNENLNPLQSERKIQELLGLNHKKVEEGVHSSNPEIYTGLEEEAFSTPFADYYSILKSIKDETLVDLGAGHCKGTILSKVLEFGDVLSLEVDEHRVTEARKLAQSLGLDITGIQQFDILSKDIPLCQNYFVYLPLGPLIFSPIERLLKSKHSANVFVMESHGDVLDFFNACPEWFTLQEVLSSRTARHRGGIHKFNFTPAKIPAVEDNTYELVYQIIQNYSKDEKYRIVKESGEHMVSASSLLPIKYNQKMAFECSEIKRIVDFENVQIFRA